MYTIVMEEDKYLRTTIKENIYQDEDYEQCIRFLLPVVYKNTNIKNSILILKYILPNHSMGMERLEFEDNLYEDMLETKLNITKNITKYHGTVTMWLTIINKDNEYDVSIKTTDALIEINRKCRRD